MKLISDIINDLIDTDKSITSPLLKTKVLASRLKNDELSSWVNCELTGYSIKQVPEYRKKIGYICGTYINGNMQYSENPIPTHGLSDKLQDELREINFYDSISTLESYDIEKAGKQISKPYPAELIALLENNIRKMGNPYFKLITARKFTSASDVTQIISVVRSKLLDFMLKLDEEFGNLTEIKDLQKNNELISEFVQNTIINTGHGNIVNTGSNSKLNSSISVYINNKDLLISKLLESGVCKEDTEELIQIIDEEQPNKVKKSFGNKVNLWIIKMVEKSLNGSWEIGVGAAGNLLAELINNYYGM